MEHQFAQLVLVNELEVVLRLHVQLRDQRVVYCPRDSFQVLGRLAADKRDVNEGHEKSSPTRAPG